MARGHRRSTRGQRVAFDDPRRSRLASFEELVRPARPAPVVSSWSTLSALPGGRLVDLVDDRQWRPESYRRSRTLSGSGADLSAPPPMRTSGTRPAFFSPVISFARPQGVVECVRRKQRREVLHALKRTRKGSKSRQRKQTVWSSISCRR